MGGYANGRFPLSMMVKLGEQHYLPAGTAARWRWMVVQALAKYGVRLVITGGWNGYRPYDIQVQYRKDLGVMAAVPGRSSHGLIYQGMLCAAIDVANWGELGWGRFKALCRLAGFTVDFVKPQELWHIGDFNDIWAVPAWAAPADTKPAVVPEEEEDDMPKNFGFIYRGDDKREYVLIGNAGSGFETEVSSGPGGSVLQPDREELKTMYDTPVMRMGSAGEAANIKASLAKVRARTA